LALRARRRLTFRHWAGVSPYTAPCGLAETCVFGKQSRGPGHCDPPRLPAARAGHRSGAPLLPKVRGQFAEFLKRGSPAHLLASSASLPVSVCGTGTRPSALSGFSRQCGPGDSSSPAGALALASPLRGGTSLPAPATPGHAPCPVGALTRSSCVPASLRAGGHGMSTVCPSPTPCGLSLGPTNPEWKNLPQEPSGFRCRGFSPRLRYSYRQSHSWPLQPSLRSTFTAARTLPYHAPLARCVRGFGGALASPVPLSVHADSTSELLRTLSRMAASKPTSWLSGPAHSLCHLAHPWGPYPAVWAVSLLTLELRPQRLTQPEQSRAFVVWLGLVGGLRPRAQPAPYLPRPPAWLAQKRFRGEPAITTFAWHFTPTHRSSPGFATPVGAGLHAGLTALHPAHG
jgi:hypothetical protein